MSVSSVSCLQYLRGVASRHWLLPGEVGENVSYGHLP
jgi:hypothetical protein